MSPYSAIVFHQDIDESIISFIKTELNRGIKVYFFTYDPIEKIIDDIFFKEVLNQLFYVYEVRYTEALDNDFIYYDHEISKHTLELLTKHSPNFNLQQYLVEHSPLNENIIVSAGAGTGKTTVMISRLLYLKHKDPEISFADIGLITFTNNAAQNLRDKLVERLKLYFKITKDIKYLNWMQDLRNMSIGTIHSFAQNVLENNMHNFDYPNTKLSSFSYIRRKIIEEVIDEFNLKYPKTFSLFKYIELYLIINAAEKMMDQINNRTIPLEKILQLDFGKNEDFERLEEEYIDFFEYVVKESYKKLERYKEEENRIDVNDLIVKIGQMAESHHEINIGYKYVFIDEFQDTDRVQTKFFSYICNEYNVNLFVVGDVKQSVYRFRGADYTAFKQLKEQTTIHKEYYLQLNYRTIGNLLNFMNEMFQQWPKYVPSFSFEENDKLYSGLQESIDIPEPFVIQHFETKIGRVNFIKQLENTDTGVLVRTNKEVNELAQLCLENNIFFKAEQDGDFFRSVPVREFYLLIKRFTHPYNWKNRYLLHLSSYGERKLQVNEIIEQFSPDKSTTALLAPLDPLYDQFSERLHKEPIFEVLDEILSFVKPAHVYANRYVEDKEYNETTRKQVEILRQEYQMNLEQLIYLMKKEFKNTIPTIAKLEKTLRIKMQTDKSLSYIYLQDKDVERLKIMTVHKAKGLEFEQVFLPFTDQKFHSSSIADVILNGEKIGYHVSLGKGRKYQNDIYQTQRKLEQIEEIGEEARLLYVALTRAKKRVYVDAPNVSNNHNVRNWGDLIAKSKPKIYDKNPEIFSY